MPALGPALRPNQWVPQRTNLMLAALWAVLVLLLWTSLALFAESLAIASLLSLTLAYFTVVPAVRPIVTALTKLRFLSLVGLSFVVTVAVGGGRPLKVTLLVFGISAFLLTSMVDVVAGVPEEKLDHARTLRMSEWRVVWEVIVLGQAAAALDMVRQNAAIGWAMLTMVEGIARGEGGIGTMLMDQNKHFHLAAIIAVQGVFLIAGFFQDAFLAWLKSVLVPFAALATNR
jgi:NitT/TauT family transport system permease protein